MVVGGGGDIPTKRGDAVLVILKEGDTTNVGVVITGELKSLFIYILKTSFETEYNGDYSNSPYLLGLR